MKYSLGILLLFTTLTCPATDVGIFDASRMNGAGLVLSTGSQVSSFRAIWQDNGAAWRATGVLTPSFLASVTVFVTGQINATGLTAAEQTALVAWVNGGGTLVVTGESAGLGSQPAYSTMLNPFGVTISGTTATGTGSVLGAHPITQGVGGVYMVTNGRLTGPASSLQLINDPDGYLAGLVMEGTSEVGAGRLFAFGDFDTLTNGHLPHHSDLQTLVRNIAKWAMAPKSILKGAVLLGNFVGDPTGKTLDLSFQQGGNLIFAGSAVLDSQGNYQYATTNAGTFDVVAKADCWLSSKITGVVLDLSTKTLDWDLPINGDVDENNAVDLLDLNSIMVNFGETGSMADLDGDGTVGLPDLNLVFLNFGLTGE